MREKDRETRHHAMFVCLVNTNVVGQWFINISHGMRCQQS